MIVYKKIPFQLGSELLLRSSSNRSHRAKSKIIGVLEKEFIMIENPVFSISENITAIVEDDLVIAYLHDGYMFTFRSRFSRELIKNIICIDYPQTFEVEQLRDSPRIKVNLEALADISDIKLPGTVKDISETGCSVEIPKIISLFKGLGFILTFTLPNDQLVKDVQCRVTSVKYNQIHKKTDVGAAFSGPSEEIAKIRELVNFCMRFKV
ncbi:MAG: PilZ domain-containing protein [Deltaproteobacteria bacterium]|jgi:c-di-GMP-binding flagellar brake protein YcgR|nr:PilZ domain-containing protein [Deltaproteobacteria bacterium]